LSSRFWNCLILSVLHGRLHSRFWLDFLDLSVPKLSPRETRDFGLSDDFRKFRKPINRLISTQSSELSITFHENICKSPKSLYLCISICQIIHFGGLVRNLKVFQPSLKYLFS